MNRTKFNKELTLYAGKENPLVLLVSLSGITVKINIVLPDQNSIDDIPECSDKKFQPQKTLNIINNINTKKEKELKENKSIQTNLPKASMYIIPSLFDKFWKIYPRKADKGKAFTSWKKLCARPKKDRPTWKEIKVAILRQKKSDRWQDPKQIPHPSTWLNQSRWLDDPAQMMRYIKLRDKQHKPDKISAYGDIYFLHEDGFYYNRNGELYT